MQVIGESAICAEQRLDRHRCSDLRRRQQDADVFARHDKHAEDPVGPIDQ